MRKFTLQNPQSLTSPDACFPRPASSLSPHIHNANHPSPHTLPATAVLAAHLAPHLAAQQSQLNARLQNTQAANAQLWSEIQAQRAEMEALLAGVEKVLLDVDGANVLLGDVADELAEETRAAERDVRAVGVGGFESR